MGRFDDQVAIVTGAGSGVGAATAARFVAEGGSVVMVDLAGDRLEAVAQRIGQPDRVATVAGDVSDPATAAAAARAARVRFDRCDVLVSNAAICQPCDFLTCDPQRWRQILDVILMGTFHFARMAATLMVADQIRGRIVAVSSVHSFVSQGTTSHYDAGKGALETLVRSLAVELGPHLVRVNAVAPGFVDTAMSIQPDGVNELSTDWFRREFVENRRIPLARAAQPEEIASIALFLASDESSYINGQTIIADGGLTCRF